MCAPGQESPDETSQPAQQLTSVRSRSCGVHQNLQHFRYGTELSCGQILTGSAARHMDRCRGRRGSRHDRRVHALDRLHADHRLPDIRPRLRRSVQSWRHRLDDHRAARSRHRHRGAIWATWHRAAKPFCAGSLSGQVGLDRNQRLKRPTIASLTAELDALSRRLAQAPLTASDFHVPLPAADPSSTRLTDARLADALNGSDSWRVHRRAGP